MDGLEYDIVSFFGKVYFQGDMWVSGRVLKLIFVEIVVKIQAKPLVHCKDWRNQEWDWKDPSNTYLGIGWNRIGWLVTHTHLRVFCGKGLQIWTPYETQLPMTPANVYAVLGWYSSNIEKKIEKDVILDIFWYSESYFSWLYLPSKINFLKFAHHLFIIFFNMAYFWILFTTNISLFKISKTEKAKLWRSCYAKSILLAFHRTVEAFGVDVFVWHLGVWRGWGLSHWSGQINSDLISGKSPKK